MMTVFIVIVALLQAFLVHSDDSWHDSYHNLDQIVAKLKEINSSSENTELFSLGTSTEGRQMYAIKISGKKSENKPVMYIQCLSHGNEWITGTQCMYFADKLSSLYGSDSKVTKTLDKMDIVILPVMNVDGYVYTRTYSYMRNWPKSRRRVTYIGSKICYGVDLNRNFGYQWGFVKNQFDPTIERCHNTFRGFGAFSEVETRNVRNYLNRVGKNLKGFLDFHGHGRQAFQMPWKYDYGSNPDKAEQKRAATEAVRAIYKVGYRQSYYSCCEAVYTGRHGGSSVDWVYGRLKVKYTYEVSVSARSGYALSGVAQGLLAGINALVNTMQLSTI
ncbi:carboxypeptidase B-like [Actinia tenebrosa]|uniref:Carboxypeptidase B-like n=1 Tax=Actinia tenebrosa TaxID=6105 RepID=A0A6P8IEI9_ACTTE|nr:carboxypeptidase B-like [Actinia tenebrosa]